MTFNNFLKLLMPPLIVNIVNRLRPAPTSIVEWEYIPEGWSYASKHAEVRGWNVNGVLETYIEKWPQFVGMVEGTQPLGLSHESSLATNEDLHSHNTIMSFAYCLTLASSNKNRMSILDWGGGIGHYYLLSQALLPDIVIDYSCKDVPVLCDYGAELFPQQNFYTMSAASSAHMILYLPVPPCITPKTGKPYLNALL